MRYRQKKEGRMARRRREKREARERAEAKALQGAPENKMQPPPAPVPVDEPASEGEVWPLRMTPEQYIALNGDSENPDVQERVALARRILGA